MAEFFSSLGRGSPGRAKDQLQTADEVGGKGKDNDVANDFWKFSRRDNAMTWTGD